MDKTKMKEENELHIQSQKQENFSDIPSIMHQPHPRGGGMKPHDDDAAAWACQGQAPKFSWRMEKVRREWWAAAASLSPVAATAREGLSCTACASRVFPPSPTPASASRVSMENAAWDAICSARSVIDASLFARGDYINSPSSINEFWDFFQRFHAAKSRRLQRAAGTDASAYSPKHRINFEINPKRKPAPEDASAVRQAQDALHFFEDFNQKKRLQKAVSIGAAQQVQFFLNHTVAPPHAYAGAAHRRQPRRHHPHACCIQRTRRCRRHWLR